MPNADRTGANKPDTIPAAMAAAGSQLDGQASYDYKCFTFKRPNAFSRQEQTREDPDEDACVLDLSSKPRRSDSDSEKENDCLLKSVPKRAKTDKVRNSPRGPH